MAKYSEEHGYKVKEAGPVFNYWLGLKEAKYKY